MTNFDKYGRLTEPKEECMRVVEEFEEEIKYLPPNLSGIKVKKIFNHLRYCYKISNEEINILFKYYYKDLENGVSVENSTARTLLIMLNSGLVKHILTNLKVCNEDSYSDAKIGLIKAIDSYNPNIAQFSTYAYACIKQEVLKKIKNKQVISLDEPLNSETLEELGMLKYFRYNDELLEKTSDDVIRISDIIKDEEDLDKRIYCKELSEEVQLCLRQLKPMQQYVLLALNGYYKDKMAMKEISKNLFYNVVSLRQLRREAETLFKMNLKRINIPEEKFRMKYSAPLMTKEEFERFPQNRVEIEKRHNILDRRIKLKYYRYCQNQKQNKECVTV